MSRSQAESSQPSTPLAGFLALVRSTARTQLTWALSQYPHDTARAECEQLLALLTPGPVRMNDAVIQSSPRSESQPELSWEAWKQDPEVLAHFGSALVNRQMPANVAGWYALLAQLPASVAERWESRHRAQNPDSLPLSQWLTQPLTNDPFAIPSPDRSWLLPFADAARAMTRLVESQGEWHHLEVFGIQLLSEATRRMSISALVTKWATIVDTPEGLPLLRLLIAFDESLNEVFPLPPIAAGSVWALLLQRTQDALLELASRLRSAGHDVQVRPVSGTYRSVTAYVSGASDVHIPCDGPPGEILRCVRVYCRIGATHFPGRVIYRSAKVTIPR
jgi:hypothetical protein